MKLLSHQKTKPSNSHFQVKLNRKDSIMQYKIEEKESLRFFIKKIFFGSGSHIAQLPQDWSEYFKDDLNIIEHLQYGIRDHSSGVFMYAVGMSYDKVGQLPFGFEDLIIDGNTWAIISCKGSLPDSMQLVMDALEQRNSSPSEYKIQEEWMIEFYPEGDKASLDYECELWIPVIKKEKVN